MKLSLILAVLLPCFVAVSSQAQTVRETELILKTSTGNISGSLMKPDNSETVVLIIAGSGPTDRDGNNVMGVRANSYQRLAKSMAEQTIASLRYDKRGIGKSASAMVKEDDLTIDTYIKDLSDWISLLKNEQKFKNVVLIGHSEGALIASVAAAKNKNIKGVVLLAGSGRNLDELIAAQLKANPNNPQFILDQSKAIMDSLKAGNHVKDVPPYFQANYRPSVQPYLISSLKYSPVESIRNVAVPVLIIQGDADLQVTVMDADLLSSANPKAKKVIVKGMNHTLKQVTDMADNQKAYADPARPLSPELVPAIVSFIQSL